MINHLIDFVVSKLKGESLSLVMEIQSYLNQWDSFEFDTEEADYIVDNMYEVMAMVDVDCSEISS